MRQVVLDTETTGLDPAQGHRIIEIGCVELYNRRLTGNTYHQYLQPDREIDQGAIDVHGITNEYLADKPRFADTVDDFIDFINGAELVIHNAPFDVGFINQELSRLEQDWGPVTKYSTVLDTLVLARDIHPGQKNNLDALCKRYQIDNSQREKHGALLDAEILADVYLAMTGGQVTLSLGDSDRPGQQENSTIQRLDSGRKPLRVIKASEQELERHRRRLNDICKVSGEKCVWNLGE